MNVLDGEWEPIETTPEEPGRDILVMLTISEKLIRDVEDEDQLALIVGHDALKAARALMRDEEEKD